MMLNQQNASIKPHEGMEKVPTDGDASFGVRQYAFEARMLIDTLCPSREQAKKMLCWKNYRVNNITSISSNRIHQPE